MTCVFIKQDFTIQEINKSRRPVLRKPAMPTHMFNWRNHLVKTFLLFNIKTSLIDKPNISTVKSMPESIAGIQIVQKGQSQWITETKCKTLSYDYKNWDRRRMGRFS